jgi:molecular chaperone GrpE (heat shock protein)
MINSSLLQSTQLYTSAVNYYSSAISKQTDAVSELKAQKDAAYNELTSTQQQQDTLQTQYTNAKNDYNTAVANLAQLQSDLAILEAEKDQAMTNAKSVYKDLLNTIQQINTIHLPDLSYPTVDLPALLQPVPELLSKLDTNYNRANTIMGIIGDTSVANTLLWTLSQLVASMNTLLGYLQNV